MLPKNLIFLLLFVGGWSSAFSQEPDYESLKIMGRVMDNGKTVENQAVIIFENNQRVDTVLSKPNGKFECVLKLHSYYTLVFPGEHYKLTSLVINTKIPYNFYYIPVYKCIIQMGEDLDDELAEKSRYEDFPLGIVKYDDENLRFELDYQYFRSRIKEVN